jgi:hypothetical protein
MKRPGEDDMSYYERRYQERVGISKLIDMFNYPLL